MKLRYFFSSWLRRASNFGHYWSLFSGKNMVAIAANSFSLTLIKLVECWKFCLKKALIQLRFKSVLMFYWELCNMLDRLFSTWMCQFGFCYTYYWLKYICIFFVVIKCTWIHSVSNTFNFSWIRITQINVGMNTVASSTDDTEGKMMNSAILHHW